MWWSTPANPAFEGLTWEACEDLSQSALRSVCKTHQRGPTSSSHSLPPASNSSLLPVFEEEYLLIDLGVTECEHELHTEEEELLHPVYEGIGTLSAERWPEGWAITSCAVAVVTGIKTFMAQATFVAPIA